MPLTKKRRAKQRDDTEAPGRIDLKRIEIFGVDCGSDEPRVRREAWWETKAKLRSLAAAIQVVVNDYVAHWLRLHYEQDNHMAVREWMETDIAWIRTPRKERSPSKRVPCPVKALDAEMARAIYAALTSEHPILGTKPIGLATQKAMKHLIGSKATKSAYPRWMRILAGYGECPSRSSLQPIPFYSSNSKLLPPRNADERWKLELRIEKEPGSSRLETMLLELKTGGWKLASIRDALVKVASGDWKFRASELVERDGHWYAHLVLEMPAEINPPVNPDVSAVLRPSRRYPIGLRIGGHTERLRKSGRDVRHVRRQLLVQRFGKSEAYRRASSSRKGHGRGRAYQWREKLIRRWQSLVKTWNEQLAADVVERMQRAGAGRLIYCQPREKRRETCFLATAGKLPDRMDSTLWDWGQMGAMLAKKCAASGIAFVEKVKFRNQDAPEVVTAKENTIDAV